METVEMIAADVAELGDADTSKPQAPILKDPQAKHTVISLFSGAGGMDIGLEQTQRFLTLACVELEPACCATLRANRDAGRFGTPGLQVFEGDIRGIDPSVVMKECGLQPGALDVLVGGPPCQTYSTVGRRGTVQDPRGMLLWEFLRFVAAVRPKVFVMENVRGLLSAALRHRPIRERPDKGGPPLLPEEQPGSVVRLWLSDLARLTDGAYHVDCFEVNAVNYGAPQLRERALIVGNHLGQLIDFPGPTHGDDRRRQFAQASSFEQHSLRPFRTLGGALATLDQDLGEIMDFSPRKKRYLARVPEGGNWRTLPVEMQKESMGKAWHAKGGRSGWWRRLSSDLPCPTLVTMPNHASTSMCHPTQTRSLSLREYAAIQEFPDDWIFHGTTSQKYAQVGNALPVRLAHVLGEVVAQSLDRGEVHGHRLPAYRQVYLHSHVRTRQWYRAGTTYVWTDGEDNAHARYSARRAPAAVVGGR